MGFANSGPAATSGRLPSDQDSSGRSFGELELAFLSDVIESGTLFAPKGQFVKRLEKDFATYLGVEHAVACSSGTAALHSTLAASDFEPGDEIITTGITDIGALAPILYQGLIPVFADVDPDTGLVTAETIAKRISERTRAIVITHLFGNPCDTEPIAALAREHGLLLIEDCAQAYGATINGRLAGTFGDVAFFSLQQGKHITAGEGGLVVTNDKQHADRMRRYVNKAWDYDAPASDHDFLALNYRLSELQGAVALAQLSRLEDTLKQRVSVAESFTQLLAGVDGIRPAPTFEGGGHSYWRYPLLVEVEGGPTALGKSLRELGIPSAARYIQKPAFRCGVFVEQKTFGSSRYPFTLARPEALDYSADQFPGTFAFLERVLVLPWNERFDNTTAEWLAASVIAGVEQLKAAK